MHRRFLLLLVAVSIGGCLSILGLRARYPFLFLSPEWPAQLYVRSIAAGSVDDLTCAAAQGQRPQDTTVYKLLAKWAVGWHGSMQFGGTHASTRRTLDEPTLAYVTLTGSFGPHGGPAYQIQPPGITLPLVWEDGEWRVCDLGTDELKVTHGPTYDPPTDAVWR